MHSGILLLDKPYGQSSNAALQRVRALLQAPKAGHVGSLDPLASGMLPICLGEATKVAGEIVGGRKRYRFTVRLGTRTVSGDAEGSVSETAPIPALERGQVEAVLTGFRGARTQTPPMYSALKRAGQPLYRLARSGLTVERAARRIELSELRLLALTADSLELETLCSKGTYIRVLAEEIAAALGTVGHVIALRRLYVEPFEHEPMHTLESLAECCGHGASPQLLPVDQPLAQLRAVQLDAAAVRRLLKGQRVLAPAVGQGAATPASRVRLYDENGRFLGLGEADGQGTIQPRRLLNLAAAPSATEPRRSP
jgi:tRNA pseudouridine55 synthase